jgi:hypothetical protein
MCINSVALGSNFLTSITEYKLHMSSLHTFNCVCEDIIIYNISTVLCFLHIHEKLHLLNLLNNDAAYGYMVLTSSKWSCPVTIAKKKYIVHGILYGVRSVTFNHLPRTI